MIQSSEHDKIANEHFEWMYHLVCNEKHYNKISYRKLLYLLHSIDFYAILPLDDNRRVDGIDFRYRFGYENGYSTEYIDKYLNVKECSVLEMMVALAFKIEEKITCNDDYGNRTGQWFWSMIVSLGLHHMSDDKFNRNEAIDIVYNFLNRNYEPNGKGGLFTLNNPSEDMRDVEINCQFMWYINETTND